MPFKSQAQRRLMYAAAKGGVRGVSKKVAEEFVAADHPGKLPDKVGDDGRSAKQKAMYKRR